MKGRRLLVATGTFWPLVGSEATTAMKLAQEMSRRDWAVEVVTPRHHPSWPAAITFGGVQVWRIGPAPHSRLNRLRYARALRRFVLSRAEACDVAYVFGAAEELSCLAAIASRSGRFRLAAAPGKEAFGDRRPRGLERLVAMDAFAIAASEAEAAPLAAWGVERRRIITAPPGVSRQVVDVDGALRALARASLGEIHPALALSNETPLAVYIGRLKCGRGIERIIDAWSLVAQTLPKARLWLVGEGPDARALYKRVARQELQQQVTFTGAFDEPSEIWRAADLALAPLRDDGPGLAHLEALAAGTPVVGVCHQGLEGRRAAAIMAPVISAPSGKPEALADTILDLFGDPERRFKAGQDGRRHVEKHWSLDTWADTHTDLLARLVAS
jgi:glycosyltransferase involved in cell wall biosynthesis